MLSLYLALVLFPPLSIAGPTEFVDSKLRRQTPPPPPPGVGPISFPPQCQTACQAPVTTLTVTCVPAVATCICPPAVQKGLFDCFSCVGRAAMDNDFTIPQNTIDSLTASCIADGHPLPKLTFPGQDPNRPLATPSTTARTSRPASSSVGQTPSEPQTSGIVTIQTSFPATTPSQTQPPVTVTTTTAPVTVTSPVTTAANNTSSPTLSTGAQNNPLSAGGTGMMKVKNSHFWFGSVGTLLAVIWM